jgi:hypothetical protein
MSRVLSREKPRTIYNVKREIAIEAGKELAKQIRSMFERGIVQADRDVREYEFMVAMNELEKAERKPKRHACPSGHRETIREGDRVVNLGPFTDLFLAVNDRAPRLGTIGVRDPDGPCEAFDGKGYDGGGRCMSDGHYLCTECSELSPEAPRFAENYGWRGVLDRLELEADHIAREERRCLASA